MKPVGPFLRRRLVPLALVSLTFYNLFHHDDLVSVLTSVAILENDHGTLHVISNSTGSISTAQKPTSKFIDPLYFERPPSRWLEDVVPANSSHHAIVIPYRDRQYHLDSFLRYMKPYLARHFPYDTFSIWIIEQDDQELFNRAWLANVGLREIAQRQGHSTKCVILHDVDMVPKEPAIVPYTSCEVPIQLGSELEHFNWTYPYPTYCGGITSLSLKHWQLINGLSNDYVGWGGEDDDLYHRLRIMGLLQQSTEPGFLHAPVPQRPPKGQGVFRTISQKAEHHVQHKGHRLASATKVLLGQMYNNSDRWQYDGINDVYYTVTNHTTTAVGGGGGSAEHKSPWTVHHIKATAIKSHDNDITATPILELVTIPYVGRVNDILTAAAAKVGIVWGACRYQPEGYRIPTSQQDWQPCPPNSGDFIYKAQFEATYEQFQQPWLLPFRDIRHNPLEGTHRFAIVRNPYERAIEYYYHHRHHHKPTDPVLVSAKHFNSFLQEHYMDVPSQLDFVSPSTRINGTFKSEVVQHVLRHEHLVRDLSQLLSQYDYLRQALDLDALVTTLLQKDDPKNRENQTASIQVGLGVEDFDNATISILNGHFHLEFSQLGYAMLDNATDATNNPRTHKNEQTPNLALLQLVEIPYNGGDLLTRAASTVGIAWGACHYGSFVEWGCPVQTSGVFYSSLKYQANVYEGQTPWLLPLPSPMQNTKTFVVVRNPYSRAIDFYRHMYDKQHGQAATVALTSLETNENNNNNNNNNNNTSTLPSQAATDYVAGREDPAMLNAFLQNAIVSRHRPHRGDPLNLQLQVWYTKNVDHVVRYESWFSDLESLFTTYNLTKMLNGLAHPERRPKGGPWLQVSDLNDVTVAMVNRHFSPDFDHWYSDAMRVVNVTTATFWNSSQRIDPALQKYVSYMSTVQLKVPIKKGGTKPPRT